MVEKLSVESTQRNANDVAMELLTLHMRTKSLPVDDIGKVFAQYFSLATLLRGSNRDTLLALLPEEMKNKL